MASMPSSSCLYNSCHTSMRARTGILWSSRNESRSIKHSFKLSSSTESSRRFWRQWSSSELELKIEWPLDHFLPLLLQASAGFPRSDLPFTLRASGNPPTTSHYLQLRNQIKFSYNHSKFKPHEFKTKQASSILSISLKAWFWQVQMILYMYLSTPRLEGISSFICIT